MQKRTKTLSISHIKYQYMYKKHVKYLYVYIEIIKQDTKVSLNMATHMDNTK